MSCEGNLEHPVCSSGLIQDHREKVVGNFSCDQVKENETRSPLLSRVNDDLRNTNGSENVSGIVDLSGFSLCNPAHLQIGPSDQLRPNNVEDWLRLTTEVNLEEYGFIRTVGVISHEFETAKSNIVDMCINNDECVAELGLHAAENNSESDKNKFSSLNEFLYRASDNCNGALLNGFSGSDSFLNYLDKTDILGKDLLLENVTSAETGKLSESTANFDTASSNMEYSLTDMCQSLEKHTDESDQITQSLEIDKDSTPWEHLYINKHSDESTREIDYPEFNLLTFHVEMCDNLSPHEEEGVIRVEQDAPKCINDNNIEVSEEQPAPDNTREAPMETVEAVENEAQENPIVTISPQILKTPTKVVVPDPRSILKSVHNVKSDPKKCSILKPSMISKCLGKNNVTKSEVCKIEKVKPGTKGVAFVAISTDKCKNTTEIVINTAHGEQVLKGKTSDLMKATSNLWVKLEKISSNNAGQTLTISTVKEDVKQASSSKGKNSSNSGKNGVCLVKEEDRFMSFRENPEDKPMLDALREHGLPMEYSFCIVSDTKYWMCPVEDCRRMFPRKSLVRIHILGHYGIRPFRCDHDGCQWSFYSYFKLKRHKETHLKRKDFQCEFPGCGKKFTTIYNLNAHQKLHGRPAMVVCSVENCGASFQTKRRLEQHLKNHHDIEYAPYRCPYKGCTKRYFSSSTLNSHARCHQHKEEELRCQWEGCSKLFDQPCRLRAHVRTHTGDKPYLCNYSGCGRAFQTSSKLKRHQLRHDNVRKFTCTVEGCTKSFYRSEHMKEHALTHIGQRIFKCPMENCSVTFSARSSLYVHMKKHKKKAAGASPVDYHCPVDNCEAVYDSRVGLRQHMIKDHTTRPASHSNPLDYITLLNGDDFTNTVDSQLFGETAQLTDATGLQNATGPSSSVDTGNALPECADSDGSTVPGVGVSDPQVSSEVAPHLSANFIVIPQLDHQTQAETQTNYTNVCMTGTGVRKNSTCRSARTHITFSDIVREKKRTNFGTEASSSLKFENDVVLGSSALNSVQEPAASFMVQEDLPITHYLYQDEPEFQILLLDPINSPQEFAESTINLRDLE